MKLHYAGEPGEGWGWGVCNANLLRELGKLVELTEAHNADAVFMPLSDHDFNSQTGARGRINLAYTFFEWPLGPHAAENAARYDLVFAGSSWCLERMRARGIVNGDVLIQGVDDRIFRPAPRMRDGAFRIFSGGKFEWRKGQDLVIAAFSIFANSNPQANAHLVCAWHNPWPNVLATMAQSPYIAFDPRGEDQVEFAANLMLANGIARSQFTVLPKVSHVDLAYQMARTDCGLFPNRCEGGTNLVMMEYLACGRPAVANLLTGQADLVGADIFPINATEDSNFWAEQDVLDIVDALEIAYSRHKSSDVRPIFELPWQWKWESAALRIVTHLSAIDRGRSAQGLDPGPSPAQLDQQPAGAPRT